jgi:hypothetical protein
MELSPAPVAKKIADRSEGGSDDLDIDIIENTEAITSGDLEDEDKKKKAVDDSSDSSASTITEEQEESPETDGGSIRAVEGSELPIGVDPKVGVLSDDSSSSSSSSSDSSSTGGSSKSETDISSSDSSDSTRSPITYNSSDSNSFIASKAKKMSSSMNKSPVCDGERNSFEEWHSKWEVFGQDHRFNEYQCDIRHPDLPVDGRVTVTTTKDEKKALKKNKKAIASL